MIKIVDLFSGCGGLTFGFYYDLINNKFIKNNKFEIVFANDYDKYASQSFKTNFPDILMLETDISKINLEFLLKNNININDIDLVIGGPPCQSYSLVGKRQYDKRAQMYQEYHRILSIVKPKMFIFENVIGLLSMKNDKNEPVIEHLKKGFQNLNPDEQGFGYEIYQEVLNAKNYGVPQSRERVFIVGIRKDLNLKWEFPKATHNNKNLDLFITLNEAIGDLPSLINGQKQDFYNFSPKTNYQKIMRGDSNKLLDHENSNNGQKILQIMKALIPGEGRDFINKLVSIGKLPESCYLTSGYGNSYGKLWWDRPSTTITNNLSTPSSLRCIHPIDSRPLTTREGARIQSFPDSFVFCGSKTIKNMQIGNAVPPLLALHLAKSVLKTFENYGSENINHE